MVALVASHPAEMSLISIQWRRRQWCWEDARARACASVCVRVKGFPLLCEINTAQITSVLVCCTLVVLSCYISISPDKDAAQL